MRTSLKEAAIWSVVCIGLFSLVTAAICMTPYEYTIHSQGRIMLMSKLHVDGKYIMDSEGNVVLLRGVNGGAMESSPTGEWNGGWHWIEANVKATLDGIRSWGCNVIRLEICMEYWLEDTQADGSGYRSKVLNILSWAQTRGIYILIDLQVTTEAEGQPALPWSGAYTLQEFLDFWQSVAQATAAYDNALYDLYNEPHPSSPSQWISGAQQAIDVIRDITDNLIVIMFGWDGDLTWVPDYPVTGGNIVYSGHLYRHWGHFPKNSTGYYIYEYDDIEQTLVDYGWLNVLDTLNLPIICGELGMFLGDDSSTSKPYGPPGAESAWFQNLQKLLNDWDLGYMAWQWRRGPSESETGLLSAYPSTPNYYGQYFIDGLEWTL